MFTNSKSISSNDSLSWFSAIWAVSIIAPLVYFPGPSLLTGHPWKVELIISSVLFFTLINFLFIRQKQKSHISNSPQIFRNIVFPCAAFILWSAASVFWADSTSSVLHHTLVWFCYLIFFLLVLLVVSDRKLLKISLFSLGSMIGIICFCCISEFVFSQNIDATFGFRYGRYAEIFAALLPLFFSLVLRLKQKYFLWAGLATLLLWFGLLFAMSRGSLIASVIGLSVFIALRLFTNKTAVEKKRLIFAVAGLILAAIFIQIPFWSNNAAQKSTFSRVKIYDEKDASNSFSQNVRLLYLGVGKEMFAENYLIGVGADNFGLKFNQYRAVFSADPANKAVAVQQEEFLPERAHNEYLQILAELGIVGAAIMLLLLGGIAKLGIAEMTKNRSARDSFLTHAAIGGIVAFLLTSMVSSYSFRMMQNGLVFFFLLAILLRNYAIRKNQKKEDVVVFTPRLKLAFGSIALLGCVSLTVFSGLKAAGQFFAYQGEKQENFETAKSYYEIAAVFDPVNASFDSSYGSRLLNEGEYQAAAAHLEQAVKKGLNDSISYSYLISAQSLANQPRQALNTAAEAVRTFPYSVFLRTRYAALLNNSNEKNEAANQLKIAEQISERQARTWWILINEGSLKASQKARADREIASLDELVPNQGLYAILAERQIIHPEEKMTFNF